MQYSMCNKTIDKEKNKIRKEEQEEENKESREKRLIYLSMYSKRLKLAPIIITVIYAAKNKIAFILAVRVSS